jgi:hypothetical protein
MRCSHLPSEHPLSNRPRILQRPRTCSLLQSPIGSDRHRCDPLANSPGVWSLSALVTVEARLPRVCLTRHLPTSGFLTLLPAYFFPSFPALFHAGSAPRVFLQGVSPPQSLRPLSEPVTFLALEPEPSILRVAPRSFGEGASPSRICSLRGFATVRYGVSHTLTTAALLVF